MTDDADRSARQAGLDASAKDRVGRVPHDALGRPDPGLSRSRRLGWYAGAAALLVGLVGTLLWDVISSEPSHHLRAGFTERFEGVPAHRSDDLKAQQCSACHEDLARTGAESCRECHGVLMDEHHPFGKWEGAALGAMAGKPVTCAPCHQEHGDGELIPEREELASSCSICHGDVDPTEAKPSKDWPTVEPDVYALARSFVTFSHQKHETVACVDCHEKRGEPLTELPGDPDTRTLDVGQLSEFAQVTYEACEACHLRAEHLAARERDEKDGPLISKPWHGAEDPEKCLQCHVTVYKEELKEYAPFTPSTRRFSLAFRSHAAEAEKHARKKKPDEQACSNCHADGLSLVGADRDLPFDHFLHLTDLEGQGSTECVTCHGQNVEADYSSAACKECHTGEAAGTPEQSVFPEWALPITQTPPEPQGQPTDFPHRVHTSSKCTDCHGFEPRTEPIPNTDRVRTWLAATTLPTASGCVKCHAAHDKIAGGGCDECHVTTEERADRVYFGTDDLSLLQEIGRPSDPEFRHFSQANGEPSRHAEAECEVCHAEVDHAEDLILIKIPMEVGPAKEPPTEGGPAKVPPTDEGSAECRKCHVEAHERFHFR